MQLEVGQVYRRIANGRLRAEYVLVLEVRGEEHGRGLGHPYGDTGIAVPISPFALIVDPENAHPFDVEILCDALPNHGDLCWRLVSQVRYEPQATGRWYATGQLAPADAEARAR